MKETQKRNIEQTMANTKFLTLGEAAKFSGYSKPTLSKALTSGKMSGVKNDAGSWQIDPAELNRAFPQKHQLTEKVVTVETPNLLIENTRLQAELKGKDREVELLTERVEELSQMTKLLAAPERAGEGDKYRLGWFDRLLGRKAL